MQRKCSVSNTKNLVSLDKMFLSPHPCAPSRSMVVSFSACDESLESLSAVVSQGDTLLSKCMLSWMYQFVCFVHTCMIFLFQRCSVDSIVTLNSKWPYSTVYYRDEKYVNTYPQIMLAIVSLHQ